MTWAIVLELPVLSQTSNLACSFITSAAAAVACERCKFLAGSFSKSKKLFLARI
jgi:hypothetical protein